jgi:pyruvate,orthophosphate dikinase
MIELPAAALLSDQIARYADFFSFGTNDLTQTTNGLSRDDVNSFFPAYTEFDLLADNPFQVLGEPVKELVKISATRGRLTRPDIKLGLCGEHGADPANTAFLMEAGLHYVSCSSYSVPIALLAVAQYNLKSGA